MPSLLFEREVDLIVSDLQEDGKITIRHRNFEEDAIGVDETTELDINDMEKLREWLQQQIYAYSDWKKRMAQPILPS